MKGVSNLLMQAWMTGMQDGSLGPKIRDGRREQVGNEVEFATRTSRSAAV